MSHQHHATGVRKGRFLWKEPAAQKAYLQMLQQRIAEGYYFSESVSMKIADEIAPILDEAASRD